MRGATLGMGSGSGGSAISIHAPHTGRDPECGTISSAGSTFQSTRPIRGATLFSGGGNDAVAYFNPRAPYGARRKAEKVCSDPTMISSHAPPTGRGHCSVPPKHMHLGISIHAPHTGRDRKTRCRKTRHKQFQSTRPIRGATACWASSLASARLFQSTRPIRGATAP